MATAYEVEKLRQRLLYDTPFWAEQCAVVRREDKKAVRLIARPWQLKFDAALEKQRAEGRPMRAIILKARKLGFSTWVQAKAMQRVTQMEAQYALTVAQDRKTAGVLFDMAKLMYERLPSDPMLADLIYGEDTLKGAPFSVRPQKIRGGSSRNGNQWMVLGHKMREADASVYETMSAGSGTGARGYTPSMIHCSELAHWDDPDFKLGLMQSLPTLPETIAVFESTANGFNHFHKTWQNAVQGSEDQELGGYYAPLFFGWQDNPAYVREFPHSNARERFERTVGDPSGGGDEEEVELIEAFGLSLEQLFWRRTKIGELDDDIDDFHQEYPATPEQAFIGSGTPVFPGILVGKAIREAQEAREPVRGVLRGADWREQRTRSGSIMVPRRALWIPEEFMEDTPWFPGSQLTDKSAWGVERLLIWEHPLNAVTQAQLADEKRKPDGQYLVFGDIALGQGSTATDGDWHAFQVLDHITRKQVARYRSRIPVHEVPLLLYLLGLYFNTAWLTPEVNNMGQSVIDALRADYGYPMLYRRHRSGDDERQDNREFLLGWATTLATKPLMEMTFGTALKEGTHGLRDVATAREATTYVRDPKNAAKHGAQRGSFDDLLMAFMGCHRMAAELQPRRPKKKRDRWAPHDDVVGY